MTRSNHYDGWDLSDPGQAERFRVLVNNLLEKKAIVRNMDVSFQRPVDRVQADLEDTRLQEKHAAGTHAL